MLNNCLSKIDLSKAGEMLIGVVGIYVSFLLLGVVYEKITTTQYLNAWTNQLQLFRFSSGLLFAQRTIIWILGEIYMFATVPQLQVVDVPIKNSVIIGFLTWVSAFTQTQAMYLVNYPLVMMAKACGLISAIIVGVFCSRVRNKELKLGPQKIVVGVIVTLGIILFRVFDPQANFESNKSVQLLGLVLLIVSLFADGFVPDFNAQIKDLFNPTPIQMLCIVNRWCGLVSFIYLLVTWQIKDYTLFCIQHTQYIRDLLLMTLCSFVGQIFIYRMIKTFKQHIVPFVIATRRIITVGLSMIYFHHKTNAGQILSILLVLGITTYEFYDNITKDDKIKQNQEDDKDEKFDSKQPHGYLQLEEEIQPSPNEKKFTV